jgi:outer membrane protein assembly factor BamB
LPGSSSDGSRRRRSARLVAAVAVALACALGVVLGVVLTEGGRGTEPPELGLYAREWPAPNGNLAGTRTATGSSIDAANVGRLRLAWRFRFTAQPGFSGIFASTPIALGGRVYLQDLDSNVYALDAATGRPVWRTLFRQLDGGPNGLAAGYGRIYGNTNRSAFALDARTGKLVWLRRLARPPAGGIDVAPVVANGLVYTSSLGLPPGGKGVLYALDAATGRPRWQFGMVLGNWAVPKEAAGGGAWWPVSVDGPGRVYVGNSNPYPWGGTRRHPNGGAYRGPALYTDSLLVLDGWSAKLLWYDQVIPHDVRDYDLADSPILARQRVRGKERDVVFGAGKGGLVYAWDRATARRLWQTAVGLHRNDRGPLPSRRVPVCPGLLGGVETPMAYAGGRLFVPVVNLCMRGSATGYERLYDVDVAGRGSGLLVALDAASGRPLWTRRFPAPTFGCATVANDVVFAPTFDGRVYALAADSGRTLWQTRARAGINACPAIDGDTLLVGAGTDYPDLLNPVYELIAFRLSLGR